MSHVPTIRFNNGVDRFIAKPLAKAYVRVVPRPVRLGVGNFFNNLGQREIRETRVLETYVGGRKVWERREEFGFVVW